MHLQICPGKGKHSEGKPVLKKAAKALFHRLGRQGHILEFEKNSGCIALHVQEPVLPRFHLEQEFKLLQAQQDYLTDPEGQLEVVMEKTQQDSLANAMLALALSAATLTSCQCALGEELFSLAKERQRTADQLLERAAEPGKICGDISLQLLHLLLCTKAVTEARYHRQKTAL